MRGHVIRKRQAGEVAHVSYSSTGAISYVPAFHPTHPACSEELKWREFTHDPGARKGSCAFPSCLLGGQGQARVTYGSAKAGIKKHSRFPLPITPAVTSFGRSGDLQRPEHVVAKTKSCPPLALEKVSIPIHPQASYPPARVNRAPTPFQAPSHTASPSLV
jgi:hypothetical protein